MGLFFIVAGACTAMPLRPSLGRRITLTDEQLAAYDRDGVVLVKGVLTGRKLQRAQAAARRVIPSNIPSKARRTSIAQGSSHSHNPTAPQPHRPTDPQTHRPTAPQPPLLNHQPHCSTTTAGITLASSFRDGAAMACYARWRATPPCQTL